MPPFFRKSIDQQQFTGPRSLLDSQRLLFHHNQVSGIIEIQPVEDEYEILLFGGGEETGAYRLLPDRRLKMAPSEIGTGWDRQEVPFRTVALPDQAGRAIWQALEYQTFSRCAINDLQAWKLFLDQCRNDRLTGMVGIASDVCDGFLFMNEGLPAQGESIFCTSEGFTSDLRALKGFLDTPGQLTLYKADPETQAYQCTLLRLGAVGWGRRILTSYKDMVGQKLLRILTSNLNSLLMHQRSNIHLADIEIIDNHFFYSSNLAAQVYQALFQDMSQLIGRVIGGMVTRRIINNAFLQLVPVQQEILSSNTLAPAAFLH